jgi:hypothetical protein
MSPCSTLKDLDVDYYCFESCGSAARGSGAIDDDFLECLLFFWISLDFFYVVSFVASFESLVLKFCLAKWKVDYVVGRKENRDGHDQLILNRRRVTVANFNYKSESVSLMSITKWRFQ